MMEGRGKNREKIGKDVRGKGKGKVGKNKRKEGRKEMMMWIT